MNHIKILFFATLRDKAGMRSLELDIAPGTTIGQLKTILIEKLPNWDSLLMEHCLAAINHEYHLDESEIPADSEIAFFPPVSGGCRGRLASNHASLGISVTSPQIIQIARKS